MPRGLRRAGADRVAAGQQRRARDGARELDVEVVEPDAFGGELVDARRERAAHAAVDADLAPAEVVGKHQDDVRARRLGRQLTAGCQVKGPGKSRQHTAIHNATLNLTIVGASSGCELAAVGPALSTAISFSSVPPMTDQTMRAVGVLTARVILGLIFGMAGYWKTFELTPIGHAQKLFIVPYANTWIPVWMLWATGTIIPVVELVTGWMVVAGWRVRECLVALGLVLITVTYGHLLIEPLFNFNGHVIPRTLLLLVVAFTPRDADWFSVDYWLERRSPRRNG